MKNNKKSFFNLTLPDKVLGIDKYFLTLFLPPLGLLIVFVASLNLVLLPKMDQIKAVKMKIKDVNASINKINEQNNYLQSMDQEELQKNAEYLDNAVLRDRKSYLLVEIIGKVAKSFDYKIESFSLTPGEMKNDIKESSGKLEGMARMPVELTLTGPGDKYLEFVKSLEKTLPILFINKFETRSLGEVKQLNLSVYSYYVSEKENVNTEEISLSDLILSKEESDLLEKISAFTKIEKDESGVGSTEFKAYERENPFSL